MFKFIVTVILAAAIATPALAYTKTEQEAAYAAAGLKKHEGGKLIDECGRKVTPAFTRVELGAHGGEAAMLKVDDVSCYGNVGSRIVLFRREGNHFQVIFDNNAGDITVLKTSHMGMFDLELGVPGMDIPIWKWNGRKYEFWKERKAELSKPTKAESVTKPAGAAAPVVQDGATQEVWTGVALDGASELYLLCGKGTRSVGFTFYLDGYHGHALKKVLDLEQAFIVEVREAIGTRQKFSILAYFVADGGWTQEARRHLAGSEGSAFLDAFGRDGRLGLQTGKGVEVASWTLKGSSQMRESMRKACNL